MKGTITALLIGMTGTVHAGQTGSFDEIAHRSWACATEAAMAEVMAQKSPDAMRSTAERERCVMLEPGTRLWTHGPCLSFR